MSYCLGAQVSVSGPGSARNETVTALRTAGADPQPDGSFHERVVAVVPGQFTRFPRDERRLGHELGNRTTMRLRGVDQERVAEIHGAGRSRCRHLRQAVPEVLIRRPGKPRILLSRFQRLGEGRHHFEEISDDAVVGHFEDGRLGILVDGHDALRSLHADQVLDRP
jgi:hypothetical protein